jgi:phosphatidylglycerol:prolipoprotein diacylglycerol transferase
MSERARPATGRFVGRRYVASVGHVRIPSYTAMLYLGCVAGIFVGAEVAGGKGMSEPRFVFAATALLVPALAGARLWFVLQNLKVYRAEPRRIWRRADGGAALYGGFVLSVAVSVPLLRVAELPFWRFWDAASVTMLVGLIVTRAGCLMHGCCAGRATRGPLGIWLPNDRGEWQRRFPTPILEAAWASIVLTLALVARPSLTFSGALFAVIAGGYGAGRLLLEPTRESSRHGRISRANIAFSGALLLAASIFFAWGRFS